MSDHQDIDTWDVHTSVPVLDHGFIRLEVAVANDLDVVNAARVSFHQREPELTDKGRGLIGFLMRDHHGTPFEHGYFRFHIRAPIFVFREWHRHRVGHSYNEWSARYSELDGEFYVPEREQVFVQEGKPGAYTYVQADPVVCDFARENIRHSSMKSVECYRRLLEAGIAKQTARVVLPVNVYSEMIWSCNPRSLMHFLGLRAEAHAQWEIQQYAYAVEHIFKELMPTTGDKWEAHGRRSP